MAAQGIIRIGTSGWSYPHWVGPFYPPGTARKDFLRHYAATFRASEVNNTFYRLPSARTLADWAARVPAGFTFACKASRYITHMKKLKDPAQSTAKFFDAVAHLGATCGPILFQLPPNWPCNPDRLDSFLKGLPAGHRYAFEFRDPSWHDERIYERLAAANAALVIYDMGGATSPILPTASLVYVRLHGPSETAYTGQYDDAALDDWARRLRTWRDDGRDVYCFFDNDEAGYAALDAQRLQTLVGA